MNRHARNLALSLGLFAAATWLLSPGGVALGAGVRADSIDVFRLRAVADGVYAALVVARPDAYAFANSLVVVGDDGVLVVDTQASPEAAAELIRQIRGVTDLPVRWVVNTHWHGDHVYGNVAYRDAYPGVRFLAHPETVVGMMGPGTEQRREELASLPASITEREGWLATGRLPDGTLLDDDLRSRVEYSARLRTSYLESLRALELVLPEGFVDQRRVLDLGRRTVELHPTTPAHTEGDIVVWVPDVGVLAVGDLLEEAAPWIEGAADLAGWGEALVGLTAFHAGVILPSHGGIQRDPWLLQGELALFRNLARAAAQAVSAEWSVARVREEGLLEGHRAFMARMGVEGAAFDDWRDRAVDKAMAQQRAGG